MKTISIDPVTRLEGHGRIDIRLDDDGERVLLQDWDTALPGPPPIRVRVFDEDRRLLQEALH